MCIKCLLICRIVTPLLCSHAPAVIIKRSIDLSANQIVCRLSRRQQCWPSRCWCQNRAAVLCVKCLHFSRRPKWVSYRSLRKGGRKKERQANQPACKIASLLVRIIRPDDEGNGTLQVVFCGSTYLPSPPLFTLFLSGRTIPAGHFDRCDGSRGVNAGVGGVSGVADFGWRMKVMRCDLTHSRRLRDWLFF